MLQLVILCPHDNGTEEDHRKIVPDYHPLTRDEIVELLNKAKNLSPVMDVDRLTQIRVRLEQGIMGMTCPRPMDGRQVANKLFLVCKLFFKRSTEGATQDLVEALNSLLNWHE